MARIVPTVEYGVALFDLPELLDTTDTPHHGEAAYPINLQKKISNLSDLDMQRLWLTNVPALTSWRISIAVNPRITGDQYLFVSMEQLAVEFCNSHLDSDLKSLHIQRIFEQVMRMAVDWCDVAADSRYALSRGLALANVLGLMAEHTEESDRKLLSMLLSPSTRIPAYSECNGEISTVTFIAERVGYVRDIIGRGIAGIDIQEITDRGLDAHELLSATAGEPIWGYVLCDFMPDMELKAFISGVGRQEDIVPDQYGVYRSMVITLDELPYFTKRGQVVVSRAFVGELEPVVLPWWLEEDSLSLSLCAGILAINLLQSLRRTVDTGEFDAGARAGWLSGKARSVVYELSEELESVAGVSVLAACDGMITLSFNTQSTSQVVELMASKGWVCPFSEVLSSCELSDSDNSVHHATNELYARCDPGTRWGIERRIISMINDKIAQGNN